MTKPSLPHTVELNGADYFLLQLDRLMWSSSKQRNVCTFVITLKQRLELDVLNHSLLANPAFLWVTSLRLKQGLPFTLSQWVVDKKATRTEIKQHQLIETAIVPESLLASAITPKNQAPFKVDLVQLPDNTGSLLVFTWHHVLMDAHGGESFINHLGCSTNINTSDWIAKQPDRQPLKERADIAQEMKRFLYDTSELPLLSLHKKTTTQPKLHYRVLSFSKQQTPLIHQQANEQGAGFLPSAFYLACTTYAVASIQQQRNALDADMLIPIPLDKRLRGAHTPIIGNQVTFLFYRLPKKVLLNTKDCTLELMQQMKQLMRNNTPNHYVIMMDFLRRIPSIIYGRVLKAPTKGLMASFFYSDTGDLFQNTDSLFNQPIKQAVHYPPNLYPPGITFVFSRFQGTLQVTLAYMESVISEQEVEQLFNELTQALLGSQH